MMINKKMLHVPDLPQGESPQDGLGNRLLLTPVESLKGADVGSCLIAPCLPSVWPVIIIIVIILIIIMIMNMIINTRRSS